MRILSIGVKEYDKNRFDKSGITTEMNKPFGRVLWGSTMFETNGQPDSEWNHFINFDFTDKKCKYGISFELNDNAKILEINSSEDYIDVMKRFRKLDSGLFSRYLYCLDFGKIANRYDAFHLGSEAVAQFRMTSIHHNGLRYADFYSYDTESWVIFNPDCISEQSMICHDNIIDYGYER